MIICAGKWGLNPHMRRRVQRSNILDLNESLPEGGQIGRSSVRLECPDLELPHLCKTARLRIAGILSLATRLQFTASWGK